jgi:hypothetical protein
MQSSIQLIQPQILVVLNILKQLNANLYTHTWHKSLSKASSLQLADRTPSYPSLPTEVNRHKLQIAQTLCFKFPDKLEPISIRKKKSSYSPKKKTLKSVTSFLGFPKHTPKQSRSSQNENPATRGTTVQPTPTNREPCEIQNPKKEEKKTLVRKKQIPRTLKPTPAMILMKQAGGQSVSRSVSHMKSRKRISKPERSQVLLPQVAFSFPNQERIWQVCREKKSSRRS